MDGNQHKFRQWVNNIKRGTKLRILMPTLTLESGLSQRRLPAADTVLTPDTGDSSCSHSWGSGVAAGPAAAGAGQLGV